MSEPISLERERYKRRPETRNTKVLISASRTPGMVVLDMHVLSHGMKLSWVVSVETARSMVRDLQRAISEAVSHLPSPNEGKPE